jgi:tripartite tricarboxylate transporter TctB family protein
MTLRADHLAGAFFIAFGVLILALSGDLPMGGLSMPGSGFLPKILAGFTIAFGLVLIARAAESRPFAEIAWSDAGHAAAVTAITAGAVYFFEILGFLTTMVVMMFALLVGIERRPLLHAVLYSFGVVGLTYVTFVYVLKSPLVTGPLGF